MSNTDSHAAVGLIETMAILDGHVRRLSRHLDRLTHGCQRLALDCPPREILETQCTNFAKHSPLFTPAPCTVLRLTMIRTEPHSPRSKHTLTLRPWPAYPAEWHDTGVHIRTCTHRLTPQPPTLAGLKHTDRRDYDLARAEWTDPTIAEGLLLDPHGHVICGTKTNLFIVKHRTLITPPITDYGIAGTTRAALLELAGNIGLPAREIPLTLPDITTADEVFLTNALINIWPVIRLDNHPIPAGALTRQFQRELENA